jgi:hypothetical protein
VAGAACRATNGPASYPSPPGLFYLQQRAAGSCLSFDCGLPSFKVGNPLLKTDDLMNGLQQRVRNQSGLFICTRKALASLALSVIMKFLCEIVQVS